MEREELDKWLSTLTPGTVVKQFIKWDEFKRSNSGRAYFKVVRLEPMNLRLIYVDDDLRGTSLDYISRQGDTFDYSGNLPTGEKRTLKLRPVGSQEFTEMLLSMFTLE